MEIKMKKINKFVVNPKKVHRIEDSPDIAVVANDFHLPFHDNKVIQLWLSFLIDLNPHHIIINGDLLDCYDASKFDKDPRRMLRLEEEIEMGIDFFATLRKYFPQTHIVYIYGNHEYRFQSMIIRKAPELRNLKGMSLEEQMELDRFDVEIVNSGLKESYYKFGEIYIGHFNKVSQHGGYTAKLLVDQKGVSVLQGHTHRIGSSIRAYLDGRILGGWDNGCMCNLRPDYVLDPNWCHGFSIIWKEKSDNRFIVSQIPIIKYKFRFGRILYSS